MKKLILSVVTILVVVSVFSQSDDYRRPASIGVSFFVNDFTTAAQIKKNGFGSVIRNRDLLRSERLNAGLTLNYLKGLSNHVDFLGTLGGSFVDYPIPNLPRLGKNKFLTEATASLNIKLLSDNFWIVPFADFGLGVSKYTSHYAAFSPMGVGAQINLTDEVFFTINSQYRVPITEAAAAHLYHSLTFYGVIGQKKK